MEFEVRQLQRGESAALVELFDAVLPGTSQAVSEGSIGPSDFLADPASFLFGAYVGDAPAGLAWGAQIRYPNGRLATYLHELDVREQFRRRGIATSLVESSMTLARRRGSTKFWLTTAGDNHGAQALYESLGGERKPLGNVNFWWQMD